MPIASATGNDFGYLQGAVLLEVVEAFRVATALGERLEQRRLGEERISFLRFLERRHCAENGERDCASPVIAVTPNVRDCAFFAIGAFAGPHEDGIRDLEEVSGMKAELCYAGAGEYLLDVLGYGYEGRGKVC